MQRRASTQKLSISLMMVHACHAEPTARSTGSENGGPMIGHADAEFFAARSHFVACPGKATLASIAGLLGAAALVLVPGCAYLAPDGLPAEGPPAAISFDPNGPISLNLGAQVPVFVSAMDAQGSVLLSTPTNVTSRNPAVVSVGAPYSGKFTAVGVGSTYVVATAESKTRAIADSVSVTVTAPAP